MSEVDWNIAPVDATHHGAVNNPDVIAWYRHTQNPTGGFQWSYWYSEFGVLENTGWIQIPQGQAPLGLPVTPRPAFVTPPILKDTWIPGEDLPPVGTECEFAVDYLAEHSSLYKKDILAGTRVRIIAHVENAMVDIAAFVYKDENGNNLVRQAIASVFQPLRSDEEIAAHKKEVFLKEFAKKVGGVGEGGEWELLSQLYDQGHIG